MKIGVIGIGAMGRPIAANLLKAGHSVVVYNRTLARAADLQASGAVVTEAISEACQADVVLTMLADDVAVEAVVFQSGEFFPSFRPDRIHVSMSTISIKMVKKLTEAHAEKGGRFISAPVFGRPESAAAASLSIVAAGPADAIESVSSIFTAIAKKIFSAGKEPFQANAVKLCGNFLLLSAIEGLAESIAFTREQGIPPHLLLEILTETLFTAPFYKTYGSLMVREHYKPAGFRLQLGLKDAGLLLEEALRVGLPMPSVSTVRDQLKVAVERGLGDHDVAALALLRGKRQELV